jgi:TonB family protein
MEYLEIRCFLLFEAFFGKPRAMQISYPLKFASILSVVWLSAPTFIRSQENAVPPPPQTMVASTYANTTEGLQRLLQNIRAAAKRGDTERVATSIKDTEIPNCGAWLHKMYESDKADSWMGLCDPKVLASNEKSMQELFTRLAKEEGEILTRKVNDNPEPGHGLEWGWLGAIRQPLDIYFASWKSSNEPKDSKGDPIGYFMFIDNGFRWESGIKSFKASERKITNAKIVQPKLVKKVDPIYPPEAAAQHIGGTVRIYYVIGGDGAVYNAHAISGEGLSNDSSLRKAAEEAVMQWRYQPGTFDGKPFQSTVTADITFSPKN